MGGDPRFTIRSTYKVECYSANPETLASSSETEEWTEEYKINHLDQNDINEWLKSNGLYKRGQEPVQQLIHEDKKIDEL